MGMTLALRIEGLWLNLGTIMVEDVDMFQSPGSVEARIVALLADVQRQLGCGQHGEAVAIQREAAVQARKLAAMLPDDVRVRQGLASVLYNLASMLVSTGAMALAV